MRIHAIQTGTVTVKRRQVRGRGPQPVRSLLTIADPVWAEPMPMLAWAIEHPEGLIVVDTGETARATQPGYFPWWHPYFRFALRVHLAPEDEIGPQLRRLGLDPRDVRRVVLTHLHTDHAGGLDHFPHSEILVSRTERDLATGRGAVARGYLTDRWPAWLDLVPVDFADRPFGPFARSAPLTAAGDVVLLPTPGHTAGHLSVAVRTAHALVVLAGDATFSERLLLEGAADGVTDDPGAHRRTTAVLRELLATEPTVLLPSHDPGAVRRLDELRPTPPRPT